MNIKKRIIRYIVSSTFFWKFRHLYDSNWFKGYANKKSDYYIKFFEENKINSTLDFGCASGSTLFNLKTHNRNLIVYGIDISKQAIDYCRNKFKEAFSDSYDFSQYLENQYLKVFLDRHKIIKFDLVMFDRVLCCITDNEMHTVLKILENKTEMILLDDFYKDQNKSYIGGWKHRNWIRILNEYGFELKFNNKTIYSKVKNSNPRSMLFLKSEF